MSFNLMISGPTSSYHYKMFYCLGPNGYRLTRSRTNPKSNLAKVVNYIRKQKELNRQRELKGRPRRHLAYSRYELQVKALGFNPNPNKVTRSAHGWNSTFFRAALKGRYLKKVYRLGNCWYYDLDINSYLVVR
jgi:hypothetical protein